MTGHQHLMILLRRVDSKEIISRSRICCDDVPAANFFTEIGTGIFIIRLTDFFFFSEFFQSGSLVTVSVSCTKISPKLEVHILSGVPI